MNKFYWPLLRFWAFTPWGWVAAIIWNLCEFFDVAMPLAPHVFGLIIGRKGKRVKP